MQSDKKKKEQASVPSKNIKTTKPGEFKGAEPPILPHLRKPRKDKSN